MASFYHEILDKSNKWKPPQVITQPSKVLPLEESSDPAIFLPLTHHNTPEGPTPLLAWPRQRSTEAFHFWENKGRSLLQLQLWGVGQEGDGGRTWLWEDFLILWYLGQVNGILLGRKYDRILNCMLMSCHPLCFPFSYQVYPVSGISYLSSGGIKSNVSYKQVDFPLWELY